MIQAEENLRQAYLLKLFTARPETKQAVSELRRSQGSFIRRQKRIIQSAEPQKRKIDIEVIDPASLDDDNRARIKAWAEEQGLETQ